MSNKLFIGLLTSISAMKYSKMETHQNKKVLLLINRLLAGLMLFTSQYQVNSLQLQQKRMEFPY